MNDEHDEERVRRILGRSAAPLMPPPFEQLAGATGRPDRRPRPRGTVRPFGRTLAMTLAAIVVATGALVVGRELAAYRQQQAATSGTAVPTTSPTANASATPSPRVALPQPVLQPITRTSPAAQVAWLGVSVPSEAATYVGVDPSGAVVGRLPPGSYWRSADGARLYGVTDDAISAYSAADGSRQRDYPRKPRDRVLDLTFSPDGRWLALIGTEAYVQIIDLQTGQTQTTPLGHDPKAAHPGISGVTTPLIWSTLLFSEDSRRLYTIVDWAGPLSLTAFDVTPTGLIQTDRAVDQQSGKKLPGCGGPGLAPKIVGGGRTLVLFCHVDGSVAFVDLPTLTSTAVVQAEQKNPFWLSPLFTPDGQLLYLHQLPAFGDVMQVIDLRSHSLLGPVPTPKKIDEPGPFSWLFGTAALAGGVASTVPISPDGSKLYAAASDGITVLRIPDLKPVAKLAPGLDINEVWISGDGKTVFATDNGRGLYVMPAAGGAPIPVTLPGQTGGFIASEHG